MIIVGKIEKLLWDLLFIFEKEEAKVMITQTENALLYSKSASAY